MEPQEGARPEEGHSDDFRMYEYKVGAPTRARPPEMPAAGWDLQRPPWLPVAARVCSVLGGVHLRHSSAVYCR